MGLQNGAFSKEDWIVDDVQTVAVLSKEDERRHQQELVEQA